MLQTGFIGGTVGHSLLRRLGQKSIEREGHEPAAYQQRSKLDVLLGEEL